MESKRGICVDWEFETLDNTRMSSFSNCDSIPVLNQIGCVKSGFHWTGSGHNVQCSSCRHKCPLWDVRNNPYMEHKRVSPDCSFVNLIESIRYVPIVAEFQGLSARTSSFPKWPEDNLLSVSSLAAAGFYYIGPMDRVRCFDCGIALKEWASEDDPVAVHKTVCPYCVYINGSSLQLLGIATAFGAQSADVDLLRNNIIDGTGDTFDSKQLSKITLTSHPDFQSLLNLGFVEDRILQEMRLKIIKTGENFESAYEFLSIVWKKDELIKKGQFQYATKEAAGVIAENVDWREMLLCKMCREPRQRASVLFLPCSHLVTCADCAVTVNRCIVCDVPITGTVGVQR